MARTKSVEVWALLRDRLRRFQSFDLTVATFCDWEGVSQAAFYVWRKILRGRTGPTVAPIGRSLFPGTSSASRSALSHDTFFKSLRFSRFPFNYMVPASEIDFTIGKIMDVPNYR